KHKYTIAACPVQCNAPEIHDVALVGVIRDGRPGFGLRVGGGMSNTPRISRDLGVFVPVEAAIDVLRAVTDVWQSDLRYRLSRAKARIKFLVDDDGPERVRARVEERLGRALEDGAAPEPVGTGDHLGIQPQRQEGFVSVGVPVPVGRITGRQLEGLADLREVLGSDARFTRQQNLIVGFVPEERLEALCSGLAEIGMPVDRPAVYGRSVACTAHRFCNYSVAETKEKLEEVLERLLGRLGPDAFGDLTIHMDGCPHACAQHWIGEVGLQGTTAPSPDGAARVEAYDLTVGGRLGRGAAVGRQLLRRVPTGELEGVLERLLGAWVAERAGRGPSARRSPRSRPLTRRSGKPCCRAARSERPSSCSSGRRTSGSWAGWRHPCIPATASRSWWRCPAARCEGAFEGVEMRVRSEAGGRVVLDELEIGEIAVELDLEEPEEVIAWGLETFDERVAVVTGMQAEGMVVLDMAARIRPDVRAVTVDTGRLPPATIAFVDEVRARYPRVRLEVLRPDPAEVEAMVRRQ